MDPDPREEQNIEEAEEECAELLSSVKNLEAQLKIARDRYSMAKKTLETLIETKSLREKKAKIKRFADTLQEEWVNPQFMWSQEINQLLEKKFNFYEFRPMQLAAINATLSKKDVILVMPTGGGKSLVFQLTALVNKGFTLVISPLLSLIEDQLIGLNKFGIKAVTVNSGISLKDKTQIYKDLLNENSGIKLLYVTPEFVGKSKQLMTYLTKAYNAGLLSRLAVDEVHCCSTWGHDFREDYLFLGILRKNFSRLPFIGLTATATCHVLCDIQQILSLEDCMVITAPFNRPNLYYEVVNKPSNHNDTLNYLEKLLKGKYAKKSGIIYTNTVTDSIKLATHLKEKGIAAAPYNSQLEPDEKKKIHERWMKDKCQVIVATVAFGMGIDKSDVRYVIHHAIPRSMESLYQESGRAGRDGWKADCIVLFSVHDYLKIMASASSIEQEKKATAVVEYCLATKDCRRSVLAKHFEEVWDQNQCEKMCDHCAKDKEVHYYYITDVCRDIHEIINESEDKLTLHKLLDRLLKLSKKNSNIISQKFNADREIVIGHLLLKKYLEIERGYNSHSVIPYLKKGIAVEEPIVIPSQKILIGLPKRHLPTDVVPPKKKKVEEVVLIDLE